MSDTRFNINDACLKAADERWKREKQLRDIDRPPAVGDVYEFDLLFPELVRWAVLRAHKEDPTQLFVVPADQFSLAGSADVLVERSPSCDAVTLRCGLGLWRGQKQLATGKLVGLLEPARLHEARLRLSDLVTGNTDASPDRADTDFLPEYSAWLDRIQGAPDALEQYFQLVELPRPVFVMHAPDTAVAAHSGNELMNIAETAGPKLDGMARLPCAGSGTLLAVLMGRAIQLRFDPLEGVRTPPQFDIVDGSARQSVNWSHQEGMFLSDAIPVAVDRIVLAWSRYHVAIEVRLPQGGADGD